MNWGPLKCGKILFVFAALLISVLPHLENFLRTGNPAWIADYDELGLYLPVAARPYWDGTWELSDPLFSEKKPVKYPTLQFAPPALIARALGLGPEWISVFWRAFAGVAIVLAWYLLLGKFVSSTWAMGAAFLLTTEPGLLDAKPIFQNFSLLFRVLRDDISLFSGPPHLHTELRIISPGISLPFLILFYWSILRFRQERGRFSFLIPAIFFGLLFYVYFYFWTAVGLGLLLAIIIDVDYRKFYFLTGVGGVLVGLPEIISNLRMKGLTNPEWLPRSDKFLPIPHFSELMIPKAGLLLLAFVAVYAWIRRRELLFFVAQVAAGIFIMNHQIVTGLQIENFHWLYHWGPTLGFTVIAIAVVELQAWSGRRWATAAAVGFVAFHFSVGLWFRHLEAAHSQDSCAINPLHQHIMKIQDEISPLLTPGSIVAGDQFLTELLAFRFGLNPLSGYLATLSPSLSNNEWNERIAANAVLLGMTESDFKIAQSEQTSRHNWGPWARLPEGRQLLFQERMSAYQKINGDSESLKRLMVRYIVRSSRSSPVLQATSIYSDEVLQIFELNY